MEIKSAEKYPKSRITTAEQNLKKEETKNANYSLAIENADAAFEKMLWQEALKNYQTAKTIKPTELYPQEKIAEIQTKMQNLANVESSYKSALSEADQFFKRKSWSEAKAAYTTATTIKPEEKYPQTQLALVESELQKLLEKEGAYNAAILLADAAFAEENWEVAKTNYQNASTINPKESYPKTQISAINAKLKSLAEIDRNYNSKIALADKSFNFNRFEDAKKTYQEALAIKPKETYPSEQIAVIDIKLAALADAETAYFTAISQGDAAFELANWAEAITSYKLALDVKKGDAYSQKRLKEINIKIAEQQRNNEKYLKSIEKADIQYAAHEWLSAITEYEKAAKYRPDLTYSNDRIVEIRAKMDAIADENRSYKAIIVKANRAFEEKDFGSAKTYYTEATQKRPNEIYPKTRLDLLEKELLAQQMKENERAYKVFIKEADNFYFDTNYEDAIYNYEQALKYLPEAQYPANQITLLNSLILENAEKTKKYNEYITKADLAFEEGNYKKAKSNYEKAKDIFTHRSYPKEQINKIIFLLKHDPEKQREKYEEYISAAETAKRDEDYADAMHLYKTASQILPEESLPYSRANELALYLQNKKIYQLTDSPQLLPQKRVLEFNKLPEGANAYSILLIKIQNPERACNIVVSYGKNDRRYGGYLLNINGLSGMTFYVAELGIQHSWNNHEIEWIKIYSDKQEIMIESIELVKPL